MNAKRNILAIATLSLVLNITAFAVEYKTVKNGESIVTSPTALIEIASYGSETGARLELTLSSGTTPVEFWLNGVYMSGGIYVPHGGSRKGHVITDVVNIKVLDSFVTVKITPASEINAAGPTSVLIIPENAEGNYDLIVESSGDLVTWNPFHSQTVQSNTASCMFRVRIVKK
jgi:hypothetical protein